MTVPPISFTLDAKSGGPGADAGSDLFSKTATPTLAVTIASPSSLNGFAGFNISHSNPDFQRHGLHIPTAEF